MSDDFGHDDCEVCEEARERAECAGLREALTASTELLTIAAVYSREFRQPKRAAQFDAQVQANQRVLGLTEPEGETP